MLAQVDRDRVVQQLQKMDAAVLDPIVSRALGEQVTVRAWQVKLVGGLDSSPMAGGVYRLSGTALVAATGQSRDWSVIVKNLRSPAGLTMPDGTTLSREMAEDQRGFGYWRREALLAESGFSAVLPTGLAAPRGLGIVQINEGELLLWQEMVLPDHCWTWRDYGAAAYRLGQWHGQNAAGQTAPCRSDARLPWLSQNWLAGWVHGPLTTIMDIVAAMSDWQHPLLSAFLIPDELAQLRQLWNERHVLLAQLATLPQTLCHLDAYRANLVWRDNELVLLDWAFVGHAAHGEELAALVGATLLLDHVPLAQAETLEAKAFEGYLGGLRDAGWNGDSASIRQGYHCAMPLRYALISLASMLRTAIQPDFAQEWERKTNRPLDEILRHRAAYIRFLLRRTRQSVHYRKRRRKGQI